MAGADAPAIIGWKIDREVFSAVPILSNGRKGPPLELRELFAQYQVETS
jgi:hypothetical protein